MTVDVDIPDGGRVTIYRFSDETPLGPAALITTRFDHVLDEEDLVGWRPNGEDPPLEYPPAAVSWEDHYHADGRRA